MGYLELTAFPLITSSLTTKEGCVLYCSPEAQGLLHAFKLLTMVKL